MAMITPGRAALRAAATVVAAALATSAAGQSPHDYRYRSGKELYEHICQGCHMPDARGASGAGAYPALAGDPALAEADYPALVVLAGQKAMPSFAELDDAQVAAVVNYVRTSFGNRFERGLTIERVRQLRAATARQDPRSPG